MHKIYCCKIIVRCNPDFHVMYDIRGNCLYVERCALLHHCICENFILFLLIVNNKLVNNKSLYKQRKTFILLIVQ